MRARFETMAKPEDLRARFRPSTDRPAARRGKARPTDTVVVIGGKEDGCQRAAWGFPAFREPGKPLNNARSETLAGK